MKKICKAFVGIAMVAMLVMVGGQKTAAIAATCPPHHIIERVTDVSKGNGYHDIPVKVIVNGKEEYLYDGNGNLVTVRCYTSWNRYLVWIMCDQCNWYVESYRYEDTDNTTHSIVH